MNYGLAALCFPRGQKCTSEWVIVSLCNLQKYKTLVCFLTLKLASVEENGVQLNVKWHHPHFISKEWETLLKAKIVTGFVASKMNWLLTFGAG